MYKSLADWYRQAGEKWLAQRIPRSDTFTLNRLNIFILPTAFGWLQLTLCLILFLLGTNYQNNLMLLLCYFLIAIFLLSLFSCYFNFAGLTINNRQISKGFQGQELSLHINLDQSTPYSTLGKLHIHFQGEKFGSGIELNQPHTVVKVFHHPSERGIFQSPRVQINSFYPLGLFRCWSHLQFNSEFVVFPAPVSGSPPPIIQSSPDRQSGETLGLKKGIEEFDSLQTYRTGESYHRIDWKQYARGRGLLTKQFMDTEQTQIWLSITLLSYLDLEVRLQHLSQHIADLTHQQQSFGLDLGHYQLEPGNGPEHQQDCLEALARYPQRPTSGNGYSYGG